MNVLFDATMVTAFYVMAHRDGRCHSCRRIGRPGMGAARHPGRIHRALHDHCDIDLPLGCRADRVEAEAAHARDVQLAHVFRRGRGDPGLGRRMVRRSSIREAQAGRLQHA